MSGDDQTREQPPAGRPGVVTDGAGGQADAAAPAVLLLAALEATADGILVVDPNRRIVAFNQKFLELWRIPPHVIEPRDDDAAIQFVKDQLADPGAFVRRIADAYRAPADESRDRLLFRDGRVYERYGQPLTVDGRPAGRVWSTRDTSRRTKAEERLRVSEERYRAIFEKDLAANSISTPAGRLLDCNAVFVRMFGFRSREHALATDVNDIFPSRAARDEVVEQIRRDGSVTAHEMVMRRVDGGVVAVVTNGIGVFDDAGELVELHGHGFDVTDQRRAEAALRESEERLRQASKMEAVGRLAGGVAHDFNNLLTVIGGYADMLLDALPDGAPGRVAAAEIGRAAGRAAGLTAQLLAFGRRQMLAPRAFGPNAVVRDTQALLVRLLGEDIEFVVELGAAGRVRADPGQIQQVLMNLALNARDAMPRGGRLVIATADVDRAEASPPDPPAVFPGAFVRLTVADTGTGMTPDVQARLFEPFFTTKELGKGTGLGLATVYGIVQQSGGHIAVTTAPGRGSTFAVYLPRHDADDAPEPAPPAPLPAARAAATLLVVEDEPAVREWVAAVLRAHGYALLQAGDGTEALRASAAHPGRIDLLVTDVVMPGMSGRELAEQARAARPGLKVLYMSGYTDDAVLRHGISAAEVAFLQKPFDAPTLVRAVGDALGG